MSATQLTVSCHCGASTHTFTVPTSSLPLQQHLCNCNISRRISGTLSTSYLTIPQTLSPHNSSNVINNPKPDLSTLTPYPSSAILTRHFCTSCGTHMYLEYYSDGHFEAATGTLQIGSADKIIEFNDLVWIGATKDGGASRWITHIQGRQLPRYLEESGTSETAPLNWPSQDNHDRDEAEVAAKKKSSETTAVHAHCHCNGIQFWISPPTSASKHIPDTPFPDLITPYHNTPSSQTSNPQSQTWWLQNGGTRYLAGLCTCTSCRRISGFDITAWAFVPSTSIFLDEACTIPFRFRAFPTTADSQEQTTLRAYESSKNVLRSFCGTCGANVFWDGRAEEGKERVVDVAVGLLDAESGVRAEEMLAWWTGRVSFCEEAVNAGLVNGLEDGLRMWGEDNRGRVFVAGLKEGSPGQSHD
jgi:hypothetical protein